MGESILDEDPAILELGILADMDNNTDKETANKTPNVVQRVQRTFEKKSYIEESNEEEILEKKKQQESKKVPYPKLSWFEENVITSLETYVSQSIS